MEYLRVNAQLARARQFDDSQGCPWLVYERNRDVLDRESMRVLVFESAGVVRCVRAYPGNWLELSAGELERLSWET
jgi:hypothetical protein